MSAPPGSSVLIMGVCGSGKTETGRELAQRLGIRFIDADAFHSTESIAKMSAGIPLTDADREPWLRRLAVECGAGDAVLACSALKAKYRQLLAAHQPRGMSVVFLNPPRAMLCERTMQRDHFMPSTLLDSQLMTLEPPTASEAAISSLVVVPADVIASSATAGRAGDVASWAYAALARQPVVPVPVPVPVPATRRPTERRCTFVAASASGCHVYDGSSSSWRLGTCSVRAWRRKARCLGKAALPELSLEPRSKVLSLINESADSRVYFVSVFHPCTGLDGVQLSMGGMRDEAGCITTCVTLICQVPPHTVIDACSVRVDNVRAVVLESDLVTLPRQLCPLQRMRGDARSESVADGGARDDGGAPSSTTPGASLVVDSDLAAAADLPRLHFPLPEGRRYLCSQGVCGALTHRWHVSTLHAIDLEAAVGTSVLAVADGRVVQVQDRVRGGGCAVRSFFAYNAITIAHHDTAGGGGAGALFVEYVHVRGGSSRVAVGDLVRCGQVIAEVGDAGFCPQPHLHIEAHRERHPKAPSVPFSFALRAQQQGREAGGRRESSPSCFVPVAGEWYCAGVGRVSLPPSRFADDPDGIMVDGGGGGGMVDGGGGGDMDPRGALPCTAASSPAGTTAAGTPGAGRGLEVDQTVDAEYLY
jgi:gluconokinase